MQDVSFIFVLVLYNSIKWFNHKKWMLFFCYFNESSLLLPKRNQEYPLPQENFVFTRFIQLKYTCSQLFYKIFCIFWFWFLRHHLLAFNSILQFIIKKIKICILIFWHKQVYMQMIKENHFVEIDLKLRNVWCVN